jgi:WD40 repeat protein
VSIVPGHQVYDASASPDGGRIATATEDGVVRIWNAATGAELQSLRHGRRARQAVFSPDGRRLASAGQIEGRHEVAIWDLATGAKSFTLPHGDAYIDHIDFAPDGARLLTIASRELRVWDLERRQEIAALGLADAERATFDSTGARLAIVERATGVLVVDATNGKRICPRIQLDNFRVSALAFTPDGRTLAVATEGGLVRLWSTETCRPTTPPFGHGRTTFVRHLAMSADGRLLATAGNDRSARVWDVATARPVTPPLPHPDGVVHVTFSPDSRRLVTAGGDSVREWILSGDATQGTDAQMLALAQVLAARRLDTTGAVSAMSLDEMRAAWIARAVR